MPRITIEIDTEPVLRALAADAAQLEADLDEDAYQAARAGVIEAQQNHPYTDRTQQLTNTAHAERGPERGTSEMVWEMDYASFVDRGTSRARPYPFTPQAKEEAARVLDQRVTSTILRFIARNTRRA